MLKRNIANEIPYSTWSQRTIINTAKECHMDLHARINEPKFYASYDKKRTPTCITNLLAHDYGRIWLQEHNQYVQSKKFDIIAQKQARLASAKKCINDISRKVRNKKLEEEREKERVKEKENNLYLKLSSRRKPFK